MSRADLDLRDADHLAALLDATGLDEGVRPEDLTEQLGTLVRSEHPAFADVVAVPGEEPVPRRSLDDDEDNPDAVETLPGDSVGLPPARELPPPTVLNPGSQAWTGIDRLRARGEHTLYSLAASHVRTAPVESAFTGTCQSVRVTLPIEPVRPDDYIGTFAGRVEARDHLLFSVREVGEFYERTFGAPPPRLERVDLVTGARHLGRRFSPVSIYLGYSRADLPDAPCFFILEGGSASGQPKALYGSPDMETVVHQQAGFSFTPLTCDANWYTGGLKMTDDGLHPERVFLKSDQQEEGGRQYLELSVTYSVAARRQRIVAPFELQVEAAMRVMAIAEQMGCELRRGAGGVLAPALGPAAEALLPWDTRPRGTTTDEERARWCGCPEDEPG